MTRQRSVFDIVGPVMIGPSSSHTAGAVRLGALARAMFGGTPARARIFLHGSFATTGHGHGTDLALAAGLLGLDPADPRIPQAFQLAQSTGMTIQFENADLGDCHPNTARFELASAEGDRMSVTGSSLGGGDVVVTEIDTYEVQATGELPLLVVGHLDRPGEIAAVSSILAESGVNIAEMRVSRERKGANALMLIETDVEVDRVTAERIGKQPGVTSVRRVSPV